MTTDEARKASLGQWKSIAPEVRPSSTKNADGTLKSFYLTRKFTLLEDDRFGLVVTNFADPYGKVSIAKMSIKGHIEWRGEHAITPGAQKVDFSADEEHAVTPMIQGFADILKQYTKRFSEWKVGESQSILKKRVVTFGLARGQGCTQYEPV